MRHSHKLIAGCAVALLATAASSQAALVLSIGGGPTIVDNGAGDTDATVGRIINTSFVGGFGLSITVANSNSPGTSSAGILQVQSLNIQNFGTGPATLNLQVSDTGFTQPGAGGSLMRLDSSVGGTFTQATLGDNVSFTSSADPLNGQPAAAVSTLPLSFVKSDPALLTESFNGADFTTFTRNAGAYSLSNSVAITLSGGGQANISGTTTASLVPEPATLAGASIALGATLTRRRRNAN